MKVAIGVFLVFIDNSLTLSIICLLTTLVYTMAIGILRPIKAGLITGSYVACGIGYMVMCIIMIVQAEENDLDVLAFCVPACISFVIIQGIVMVYMIWASKSGKIDEFYIVPKEHVANSDNIKPQIQIPGDLDNTLKPN
mmetsp:Transcript_31245/g.5627  ORF Transcript_31245/g.5627 Transcript_31245/m.5627 type:complete len:139 (+) Transcript_31245:873-1289(+)